ncbi:hypothetical protein NL676_007626 [Syzygium grande]|nr:hypothetical protein NL676_007626 [Syzygium grande]
MERPLTLNRFMDRPVLLQPSSLVGDEASCGFVRASCRTALLMNVSNEKCVEPLTPKIVCQGAIKNSQDRESNSEGVPNQLLSHSQLSSVAENILTRTYWAFSMSGSSRLQAGPGTAEFITHFLIIWSVHFPAKSMHHDIIPRSRHIPHSAYINLESPAMICAISRNPTCNNKAATIPTQTH